MIGTFFVLAIAILGCSGSSETTTTQATPLQVAREPAEACRRGESRACFALATMFDEGRKLKRDLGRAATLYARGCQAGLLASCRRYAHMLRRGEGLSKDDRRARKIEVILCDQGHAPACYDLAQRFARATPPDKRNIVRHLQMACSKREPKACRDLGTFLAAGILGKPDFKRAHNAFARGCNAGEPQACLEEVWLRARGCLDPATPCASKVSEGELREAVQALCENANDVGACTAWAVYLDRADRAGEARKLLAQTCLAGNGWGCLNLATMERTGRGGAVDIESALRDERRGCQAGNMLACRRLGESYVYGEGVGPDVAEGARLWTRACKGGNSDACEHILVLCGLGRQEACPPTPSPTPLRGPRG